MVLGAIVGMFWGEGAANIKWMGDAFIRLIRMIVAPLIFTTLVSGIIAMGDPRRLGSIGLRTFALYLGTTAVAISIGLGLAVLFQPGAGVDLTGAAPQVLAEGKPLGQRLMEIIPQNPVAALAEGDVLAIILFSIFFGTGILLSGDKGKPVASVMESAAEAILKVTQLIMELAPFGVFALIAWVTGARGISALLDVSTLAITFVIGCGLHIFLTQGSLIRLIVKRSVITFLRGSADAQLVAFSTSSSAATLPVTMKVAEDNLGIGSPIASSVLPLGATINMDGTALYVGIVAIFAAQAFGIELSFADYLLVAATTTLVSIGTAAVPSASLFLLAAVLDVLGIGVEQTAIVVGFLLPFDRPLDMLRTVVNVTGDLAVSATVAKWEGEFDGDVFEARPAM